MQDRTDEQDRNDRQDRQDQQGWQGRQDRQDENDGSGGPGGTDDDRTLVRGLAVQSTRLRALEGLLGTLKGRESRGVTLGAGKLRALAEAAVDPSDAKLRWWAIQVLDHAADPEAIGAIVPALWDPVPRVRRNAVHALGCDACKPGWSGALPFGALERITAMAEGDPNEKVRREARRTLACRPPQASENGG